MKVLRIEPFSGISGDMMLGALLDLGAAPGPLIDLPRLLGIPDASISVSEAQKCGIRCTKVTIVDNTKPVPRHLHDILEMIDSASIPPGAKRFASQVFGLLGEAEAGVHGTSVEKIHFHEVGAVDSILDIVGAALLLDNLEFSSVISTPICVGAGFVHCDHGKLPVPAPATELLLQGMPCYPGDVALEMTTPTGVALLKALAPSFETPVLRIHSSGYGAGSRDLEQPNCLRIGLGESIGPHAAISETQQICVIQANLDDVSGEFLGEHFQTLLFSQGALDFSIGPLVMKKGRPGQLLEVLCLEDDFQQLANTILRETTTLGLRHWRADRVVLHRFHEEIRTRFGRVRLKCATLPGGDIRKTPEYEDCRECAVTSGVPVQQVFLEALQHCAET